MNLTRRTLVSLLWSLVSLPCVMAVSVLVVPIYVARLGSAVYGAVLLAQQLAAVVAALVPNPGEATMQRLAASHGAENRFRMKEVLGTGIRATYAAAGITFLTGAVGIASGLLLPLGPAEVLSILGAFLIAISAKILADALGGVISALQRPNFIGVGNIASAIAGPLLAVLLIGTGLGAYSIPAGAALAASILALAFFLRAQFVAADLLTDVPRFSREVFYRDLWPLTRARWLAVIPTALGPGSDRIIAGATSGSRSLVTNFTLTGRLPDLLAMVIPSVAGSAVPALAYASDAKNRNPVGAARDLLAAVVALAAGATSASIVVLRPFLALWVPTVTPLGPIARSMLCLALLGRAFGSAGAAVLNGYGRNQALPRLSWLNAIATIMLGGGGGFLAGVNGVAVGFGSAALLVLMPLMARALAAEGILDGATLRRLCFLALACGVAGFVPPRLVLSAVGPAHTWWTLGVAVSAAGIAAAIVLLICDQALRGRVMRIIPARAQMRR